MESIRAGTLETDIPRSKSNLSPYIYVVRTDIISLGLCFYLLSGENYIFFPQIVKIYHTDQKVLVHKCSDIGILIVVVVIIIITAVEIINSKFFFPWKMPFFFGLLFILLCNTTNRKKSLSWGHITWLVQSPDHCMQWENVTMAMKEHW